MNLCDVCHEAVRDTDIYYDPLADATQPVQGHKACVQAYRAAVGAMSPPPSQDVLDAIGDLDGQGSDW